MKVRVESVRQAIKSEKPNMNNNVFSNYAWVFIIIILFGVVYQISGTFVYVDGDDATSIAYHVMGRDKSMQLPYSPYHGMMDKVLSILPAQEELVRVTAFGATRLAAILMMILIFALVYDWLNTSAKHTPAWHVFIVVTTLIAAPEFFYFGLVYAPTFIAMCFILSAHLMLRAFNRRADVTPRQRLVMYGISLLLFGFGVAFRWNTIAYGIVIAADLFLSQSGENKPILARLGLPIGWGVFALVSSVLMIAISGIGVEALSGAFETILYVFNQAGTLSPDSEATTVESLMRTVLTLTPLFTPGFALVFIVGVIKLIKDRNPLLVVILAGILSILPWIGSGVPKFIITSLPLFVLTFVVGLDEVTGFIDKQRYRSLAYAVLFLALIAPWLIGVRIQREGTAWGPGFELRQFDYAEVDGTDIGITFGPGTAFPTPESTRPLFGHAHVLFAEWKRFTLNRSDERQRAIDTALQLDIPIVTTSWSPDYYLDMLYAMGFQTSDPADRMDASGFFLERRYGDAQGETISVLYHEVDGEDIAEFESYIKQNATLSKIVLLGYPKTMHAIYTYYPESMEPLGTNSAIVDLDKIRDK